MFRQRVALACAVAASVGISVPLLLAAQRDDPGTEPRRAFAVQTELPGLSGSPGPDVVSAALSELRPTAGQVDRVVGPFDDRISMTGVVLRHGVVSGTLTVTSDVSEVIELQVLVGFYDAGGNYLGKATYEKHGENAGDVNERLPFRVVAPAHLADAVSSAAVGVPVLVNE